MTGVFMTTGAIEAGGTITFDGLRDRDVFLYVVRGEPRVNGIVPQFNLELGEGDGLEIRADLPAERSCDGRHHLPPSLSWERANRLTLSKLVEGTISKRVGSSSGGCRSGRWRM
jgi:hypothetical protein